MRRRVLSKTRGNYQQILDAAGLQGNDLLGILDVCKGLSVNDSYWLDDGSGLTFDEINLYDNQLDETLAIVAYTGHTSSQRHRLGLSTEWTTDGQFPKAWRRIGDGLFLYKAGSDGAANAGTEPYSEYLAAQVAEAMGLSHVPYELKMWKGKLASVCPLLNSKETSFVSFSNAMQEGMFPANLALAESFSAEALEDLRSMLVFDALICNRDRHAGNYGMLRDNATGRFLRVAPLFDHNLSLFAGDMEVDFPNWNDRANTVFFPQNSDVSFLEQASVVMGEAQHEQLRRLIGFEFSDHRDYPVGEKRLDALNSYVQHRTREFLSVPVVDNKSLRGLLSSVREDLRVDAPALHYLTNASPSTRLVLDKKPEESSSPQKDTLTVTETGKESPAKSRHPAAR